MLRLCHSCAHPRSVRTPQCKLLTIKNTGEPVPPKHEPAQRMNFIRASALPSVRPSEIRSHTTVQVANNQEHGRARATQTWASPSALNFIRASALPFVRPSEICSQATVQVANKRKTRASPCHPNMGQLKRIELHPCPGSAIRAFPSEICSHTTVQVANKREHGRARATQTWAS